MTKITIQSYADWQTHGETQSGRKGLYADVPDEQYHADKRTFSSSLVKKMATPARAKRYLEKGSTESEAKFFGRGVHCYTLERDEFERRFIIKPTLARSSKANRASWSDFYRAHDGFVDTSKPVASWDVDFYQQTGIVCLSESQMKDLQRMAEAVADHQEAMDLLEQTKREISGYWRDRSTGLALRLRADAWKPGVCVDIKSIQTATERKLENSVRDWGYDTSAVMYTEGLAEITGVDHDFFLIYVEKDDYLVAVRKFSETMIEEAYFNRFREYLIRLRACLKTGEWPGIPTRLDWYVRRFYEDE